MIRLFTRVYFSLEFTNTKAIDSFLKLLIVLFLPNKNKIIKYFYFYLVKFKYNSIQFFQ